MYQTHSISLAMKALPEMPVIIETNQKTAFTVARWLGGFFFESGKGRTRGLNDDDRVQFWDFKMLRENEANLNTYQKLLDLINRINNIIVLPDEYMKCAPQHIPREADPSLSYTHLYREGRVDSISAEAFDLIKGKYSGIWAEIQNRDVAFISQYSINCITAHVQYLASVKTNVDLNRMTAAQTERQRLLTVKEKGCCTLL